MKKILLTLALGGCILSASAQEISQTREKGADLTSQTSEAPVVTSPSTGDYFNGLTRPLTFNRIIPPYAL